MSERPYPQTQILAGLVFADLFESFWPILCNNMCEKKSELSQLKPSNL